MSILAWIILGGIAGWLFSLVTEEDQSRGIFLNLILGIVGAFLGGLLFTFYTEVVGFNFISLIIACIGAIILVAAGKTLRG
jgi:uncharacterized membrane protein YeaQ/YmgE (transglycosylase-associated protein family)